MSLAPGSWLGVMGGGQLGRMFVHAAQAMGYRVCVLDPASPSPAGDAADAQIVAAYDDEPAIRELARRCHAVTTEFENVPARSLDLLAETVPVRPNSAAVAVAQDRLREKRFVQSCGVPVAPFAPLEVASDVATIDDTLFPAILKTARLGYDGKGQIRVDDRRQLTQAWQSLGSVACVLERRLALARELSVIVARAQDRTCVAYPPFENIHAQGILARTTVPAPIDPGRASQATEIAMRIAATLDYVGVLCVEFFELADGTLLVNEMAPRPHNSGHATIDSYDLSQFDLQVRCLAGLPLTAPRLHSPAVMLNLLGDLWFLDGESAVEPAWSKVLAMAGAHLHLYGKSDARPGRKMGHLTLTAADAATAAQRAALAATSLRIPRVA
jgi:5-(carboxyamino)imidazole ribonucleotide synthase